MPAIGWQPSSRRATSRLWSGLGSCGRTTYRRLSGGQQQRLALAMAVVGRPELVSEVEKARGPYKHTGVAERMAVAALTQDLPWVKARVEEAKEVRQRLVTELRAVGLQPLPSEANFVLFRPTAIAGREVWQALLDRSVLVRDCSGWPRLEGCLRVTVGTADENDRFLAALTEVLT